ncbi:hypothetical protein [Streptomyces zinciresistens]|uniref:hypothetical protein n=1 Tax=Streptomyces zinciresistens TaxID=1073330 RepID=UPI0011128DCC|nr:hypothetical protein [Streptomyces zinciresistens]
MENVTPPPFAELKEGVTAKDLREAISKSGYPFQAVVADLIAASPIGVEHRARIQEEWTYVDRESGQVRSIDILADLGFQHGYEEPESDLRVRLSLLVECKQSDFPYVFFLRQTPPSESSEFPDIAGLDVQKLRVFIEPASEGGEDDAGGDATTVDPSEELDEEEEPSSFWINLRDALSLQEIPFFGAPAPFAISLAKVFRKNSRLEITGEETYRSLTLPLLKAADHLRFLSTPEPDHPLLFPRIIVNVAVVRAPMVSALLHEGQQGLLSLPWVRISHLEPTKSPDVTNLTGAVRYFDVVHESFFPQYLEVLARDAEEMARRMHLHSMEISSGAGFFKFEDDQEFLVPLPQEYERLLEEPCTMNLSKQASALGFRMNEAQEGAVPQDIDLIGWVDAYDWLNVTETGI